MTHFPHPSWVEVNLEQFRKNIEVIRSYIGTRLFCLVVKANAYGHGLCPIGIAAELAGVDYLAVAHLQEGILLRQAKVRIPILVLGAIHEDQIDDLINFNLEFSISSQFKADLVASKCRPKRQKVRVHLEVDTGMQRTGVRPQTAISLFSHLEATGCFDVVGIYSHLATADLPNDPFAMTQIEIFKNLVENPIFQKKPIIKHLANSGGICHYNDSMFDMVRPSFATFGYPFKTAHLPLQELKPCLSVKSKISYVKIVDEGVGISYGHSYKTKHRIKVATIPIGYGDGYRRSLSNKASILLHGEKVPVVGTICMDQFMINAHNLPVHVGDEVVLLGKQHSGEILLQEFADLCETSPYEILCGFSDRLPRIYL